MESIETSDHYRTDLSLCKNIKVKATGKIEKALIFNVVQAKSGRGADFAYLQNIAYYVRIWADFPSLALICPCPTLLIDINGTTLSFSGCINLDTEIICDPLCTPVSMLWCPHDLSLVAQVASRLRALRNYVKNMEQYYSELKSRVPPQSGTRLFPYCTTFTYSEGKKELKYSEPMHHNGKIYTALLGEQKVVVKFTRSYCVEAHQFAALHGFAPKLIGYKSLAGAWIMVVMEHMSQTQFEPIYLADRDVKEGLQKPLIAAVKMLHAAGFVHGDLRSNNIFYHKDTREIRLIDFDWSGKQGEARYPPFINTEIAWPDGVQATGLIHAEHDLVWVRSITASYTSQLSSKTPATVLSCMKKHKRKRKRKDGRESSSDDTKVDNDSDGSKSGSSKSGGSGSTSNDNK